MERLAGSGSKTTPGRGFEPRIPEGTRFPGVRLATRPSRLNLDYSAASFNSFLSPSAGVRARTTAPSRTHRSRTRSRRLGPDRSRPARRTAGLPEAARGTTARPRAPTGTQSEAGSRQHLDLVARSIERVEHLVDVIVAARLDIDLDVRLVHRHVAGGPVVAHRVDVRPSIGDDPDQLL